MLAEIINIIVSPAGLIVGVIFAVLAQIILGFLNLMYGKSKNAIFTFTKERSEKQRAARQRRVELMKREEKHFHYYLSKTNSQFLVGIGYFLMTLLGIIGLSIGEGTRSTWQVLYLVIVGGVSMMAGFYFVFEGAAIQQDIERSLLSREPPGDDDQTPL